MTGADKMSEARKPDISGVPAAPWALRLPIIRHVRAAIITKRINDHYAMWGRIGFLPVNADYDYAVRDAIWRGEK